MVRKEIAEELSAIARDRGKPLANLMGEILQLFLRARARGYDLDNILDQHEAIQFAKNTECMIVPMDLVQFCMENLYAPNGAAMREVAYEFGARCSKHIVAAEKDMFGGFAELVRDLLWGLTEFSFQNESNDFIVRACAPTYSKEVMELCLSFLKGYMHAIGFQTSKEDVSKGILQARFARRPNAE